MAAASYATDLALVNAADATTGWAELSGHTSGGAPSQEQDYFIQNTACVSQSLGTKTGTAAGLQYDNGGNLTWTTNDCIFIWQVLLAGNAIDTFGNGGLMVGIGSTSGNVKYWKSNGSDFNRNPYGGWLNVAIDPTRAQDATESARNDGTAVAANYRIIASSPSLTAQVSKGNMHACDIIRYGRGIAQITNGDLANGYATFTGLAAQNDAIANRWGLFSEQGGVYLQKGVLSFGVTATACDFRDSNAVIRIDNTPRTFADFNRIEVNNAASRVDLTGVSFLGPTTVPSGDTTITSKGNFEMIANATVNLDGCSFSDMGTFIFQSGATLTGTQWNNCGLITGGSATMDGVTVNGTTVTGTVGAMDVATAAEMALISNSTFKNCGASYALKLSNTTATSYNFDNITFSGNTTDIYVAATTGTVTINILNGGTAAPTVTSAGATVSIVNAVTLEINGVSVGNGVDTGTTCAIYAAAGGPETVGTQLMNEFSDATGTATQVYNFSSNQPVVIRARQAGFKPFNTNGTITSNGLTVTAVWQADPNYGL